MVGLERKNMEIWSVIHDMAIVMVFAGVVILPRAVQTYLSVRDEDAMEQH